jgi:hypothetical protein
VDSLQQELAIPTYFPPGEAGDHDWAAAKTRPLLGIAVINPASGPGYTSTFIDGQAHDEYQHRIDQMHAGGGDVVGYVTTNYRDSRGTTVQGEHHFTFNVAADNTATDVVTTREADGVTTRETGWTTGFGPIQVRPETMPSELPGGLAVSTDYFWIPVSPTAGKFAASKTNATNDVAKELTSVGGPAAHVMGLSRTLANIANVFFEIDQFYERWPAIDGMFFDEMNDIGDAEDVEYYGRIFNYVKAKGGKAVVVENPGKSVPALMLGFADVFMTFESPSSEYADYNPKLKMNHPARKFWHAIYACPADEMPGVIGASRAKNAGYIYVTDRTPGQGNVWRHIASYFLDEIYEVQYRNTPPAVRVR